MTLPPGLKAGCFFVSHGSGVLGGVIRHATESWAGHAGVFLGPHDFNSPLPPASQEMRIHTPDVAPAVVEARWPQVRISRASRYPDAHWAVREPLTGRQRDLIVARARKLCGDQYDAGAYLAFAAIMLHVATAKDMAPLFRRDEFRVCSALVADTRAAAGIQYWPGSPVNCVSPADLLNLAVEKGWF